jgi:O-antigen ligase
MESRGGLLGVVLAFIIGHACRRLPQQVADDPGRKRFPVRSLAAGAVLLLLAAVFGSQVGDVVSRDVLLLDDDYRGLDTGFSGRTEVWQEAWAQWLSHPVFGLGFLRDLEEGGVEDMNRAHSLPLTLLSETGLVGFAGFLGFSLWGLRNGMRLGRGGNVAAGSTIITAVSVYWIYGIFEGLAINVGNPLSALFFLVVFASAIEEAPS